MPKPYIIHSSSEIDKIRKATQATAFVRDELSRVAKVGMSSLELDQIAGALIAEQGGTSAFLGYGGFPRNICISINEEIIHGIGVADRIFQENDIVSIDVGVAIDGGVGDSALTFGFKDELSPAVEHLFKYTQEALMAGIEAAKCGNFISDISRAVEKVAKSHKLGVVREFVGHGCGTKLHEPPEIPNYYTGSRGVKLQKGMVLAIEPMFTLGSARIEIDRIDRWTVRTKDKSLSAHFEHMILITDNKPEILTWPKMM